MSIYTRYLLTDLQKTSTLRKKECTIYEIPRSIHAACEEIVAWYIGTNEESKIRNYC